jgi:hypothetical protein
MIEAQMGCSWKGKGGCEVMSGIQGGDGCGVGKIRWWWLKCQKENKIN